VSAPRRLLDRLADVPVEAAVGSVAVALADRLGLGADRLIDPLVLVPDLVPIDDDIELDVDSLGQVHELGQARTDRRRRGSHYTPADVAGHLVALAQPTGDRRVCDPTAGGGAFLLAAGRALERSGVDRHTVVADLLWGADIDPVAAATCRTALALWAGRPVPEGRVVEADTLAGPPPWPGHFDVVVGNPPFLTPLARATAPDDDRRARLRARFGDAYGPYVDAAALFLLVGLEVLAPRGRMVLVQPLSFLAARDAGPVRARLMTEAPLTGLWVAVDQVFGASVEVCAPVVERGSSSATVALYRGREVVRVGVSPSPTPDRLAPMAAPLVGIPAVVEPAGRVLGDQADVVAGFRDEYYAIAAATTEGGAGPRVVTVGRIGPLRLDPDGRPVRVRRRDYTDPRLDIERLERDDPKVARWLERLLVPKILVATQTAVLEAVADPDGTLVPITPVLAVVPPPDKVWTIAGLLTAPTMSALAAARTLGSGRHHRVVKLAAREVRQLPAAGEGAAWREVARRAEMAQRATTMATWRPAVVATARAAEQALGGAHDEIVAWWAERLGWSESGAGLHERR